MQCRRRLARLARLLFACLSLSEGWLVGELCSQAGAGRQIKVGLVPARHAREFALDELRLEMWFHSVWYGDMAEIKEFDILKPCPQGQIWPFCSWCQNFHLPYHGSGSHRCSWKHSRALAYLESYLRILSSPSGEAS